MGGVSLDSEVQIEEVLTCPGGLRVPTRGPGAGARALYHRRDSIQGTDYIANYFFLNLRS